MALTAKVCIVSPEQGPVRDMEPGRPTTFKLLSEQTSGIVKVQVYCAWAEVILGEANFSSPVS